MPLSRTLLLGVLLSLGLSVLTPPAFAQQSRTVTRSFPLDRDGHVELDTFTGRVDVAGADQGRVEVEARIEGEEAELVDATRLRFEEDDERLSIKVDYEEVEDSQKFLGLFSIGDVDRPDVHLTITMPRTAGLTIDDFSSEVTVEGLRAGATLDTFSSTMILRDMEGPLDLETFSGEIEGDDLRGSVQLETFSGDARLRFAALTGDSDLETFSGDVELTLPVDAGFELVGEDDAFGDLDSAFALRAEDGRRIAGDGGPRIEIDTFSGELRLRKQ